MGGKGSGSPKGELMVLDGHALIDGKLERSKFFDFLGVDLSDYSHTRMTPKQALKFKNTIVRMKHGVSAAIPMICGGPKCPNKLCAFHEEKNWPLAKPCLYEVRMVQALTASYMEDLVVEPDCLSEMVLVNKLVECDLIDYRANIGLSGGNDEEAASLLSVTVVDNGNTTSENINLHPLLEAKSKAHKERMQILESLAATRRERYKKAAALKKSDDTDTSVFLASLKATFDEESTKKDEVSSLDRIKEDAKKVSNDLSIEADWEEVED
jgi:hypothetical protein